MLRLGTQRLVERLGGTREQADKLFSEAGSRLGERTVDLAPDEISARSGETPARSGETPQQYLERIERLRQERIGRGEIPAEAPTYLDTPETMAAHALAERDLGELSTHRISTPEREALRARVLDEMERLPYVGSDPADPTKAGSAAPGGVRRLKQAFLITGLPGAGKTTTVDNLVGKFGARVLDPDVIKAKLPEFEGGRRAERVHKESTALRKELLKRALERGDNVVIPTVGDRLDKVQARIDELEAKGYKAHLIFVGLPPEEAARRALQRFREKGRYMPLKTVLIDYGLNPEIVYNALRDDPRLASYTRLDNNVPLGEAPRIVERSPGGLLDSPGVGGRRRTERRNPPGPRQADLAPGEPANDVDLFGNPLPLRVTQKGLFTKDEIEATRLPEPGRAPVGRVEITPGLETMVSRIMPKIRGTKIPTAERVRAALLDEHGPQAVQAQLNAGLRTHDGLAEITEAVNRAERGRWLFGPEGGLGRFTYHVSISRPLWAGFVR